MVSNFLRKGDGRDAPEAECRPAQGEEVYDALSLILGTGGAAAGPQAVQEFLQFAAHRGIDLGDLWVAGTGGRMDWAILPIVSPGRTMLLFAPTSRPRTVDVGRVLEAVCQRHASRGIHLAQVLIDPADAGGQQFYGGHSFRAMAYLLYLQSTTRRAAAPVTPAELQWRQYSAQTHALFSTTILETYRQSLDCPGLNGLRDIEDVIAGHKASGDFDPRFWYALTDGNNSIAVLLLNRVSRSEMAELVYLGVVPQARGRGVGDLLMRHALWSVGEMKLERLTLAVDSRNQPALRLYFRHGLQQIGCKVALMRDLRELLHTPCTGPISQ